MLNLLFGFIFASSIIRFLLFFLVACSATIVIVQQRPTVHDALLSVLPLGHEEVRAVLRQRLKFHEVLLFCEPEEQRVTAVRLELLLLLLLLESGAAFTGAAPETQFQTIRLLGNDRGRQNLSGEDVVERQVLIDQ